MPIYRKVTEFRTAESFSEYLESEGIHIGIAASVSGNGKTALSESVSVYGRQCGNRWAILPMEGWDCQADGTPSEYTRRRWLRFASSGAKLFFGTEAGAVMHTGRSNPRQLLVAQNSLPILKKNLADMRATHRELYGTDSDLSIGLQLTHSGRYSHPNLDERLEPVTAYMHPILDVKFHCGREHVITDYELGDLIAHFVDSAKIAQEAGFDFVDIKHAHGYLIHEFMSAVDRPGRYGGSFENRMRLSREIIEAVQRDVPGLAIAVRLSIYDSIPFVKGENGIGVPTAAWPDGKPYPYAFGSDPTGLDMDPDLKEPVAFVKMLQSYGISLIGATIGSPYYSVHLQRPAFYPVCDGYEPPKSPLYFAGCHLKSVKRLKELCPDITTVAAGLTCLQEFLPNAAEYAVANHWTDFAGVGRMVLSYPEFCRDALNGTPLDRCRICRTFGECTNAPRHGMISGCYPLDDLYRKLSASNCPASGK